MTTGPDADDLPWGLHDAYVDGIEIDWVARRAALSLRAMVGERQEQERRVRAVIEGLAYVVLPTPERASRAPLRIHEIEPIAAPPTAVVLPESPVGSTVWRMYASGWNRFAYLCGDALRIELVDAAPSPRRERSDFRLPGDEIPD